MGNLALNINVDFDISHCGECGGTYALNARYVRQKRDKGGYWHCPYCQCSWGYGKSEIERVREEAARKIEAERQRREWAEQRARSAQERADHQASRAAGFKGALTKAKKRASAGVCPCCNRSFENLRRHMASKHPDYAKDDDETATVEAPETPHSKTECGADTASGEPCGRKVWVEGSRCWQHADSS